MDHEKPPRRFPFSNPGQEERNTKKRLLAILSATLIAIASGAAQTKEGRQPVKAMYAIELTASAGAVEPIHSSGGDSPGFNVLKMSLKSDGKQIVVAATLKEPPGSFPDHILELYFDTDNDAKSGAQLIFPAIGGFEYHGKLDACVGYTDDSSSCVGGLDAKVKAHWSTVHLDRYNGTKESDNDTVISRMLGNSPQVAIAGNVVQGSFDYHDLNVKPGQTIRLVVQRPYSDIAEDGGFFPDILLTLK